MQKEAVRCMVQIKDIVVVQGKNPRGNHPLPEVETLANSLVEVGQLQPILLRPADAGRKKYALVAGERRLEAAKLKGWSEIEAKIVEGSDFDCAVMALTENGQRQNMDPYAEAEAYLAIMNEFKITQAQLAAKLCVSEPHISQRLKILRETIPEVRKAVFEKVIPPTLARELAGLPIKQQKECLQQVMLRKKERGPEGKVTVSEFKSMIDENKRELKPHKCPDLALDEENDKTHWDDVKRKAHLRPKDKLIETLSLQEMKLKRAKTETAVLKVKERIETLEYTLGLRDSI